MQKRWLSVELNRGEEELAFRTFLTKEGIEYDSCGAYNLVHFSCLMDERERELADNFLGRFR